MLCIGPEQAAILISRHSSMGAYCDAWYLGESRIDLLNTGCALSWQPAVVGGCTQGGTVKERVERFNYQK